MAARRREILAGTVASLGLAAGKPFAARAAGATHAAAARPPLVIGALFPMTGALAAQGNECLRGVQIATELCNAGGGLLGRPVSLALGDAADPDRAVAEARRLIAGKAPALILGTGASELSLGASEASEGSGIPYWELTATLPSVTSRGFHYLLRVCDIATDTADCLREALGRIIAPALHKPVASVSVALLYADDAGGSALQGLVQAASSRHAMAPPMSIAYQTGAADFNALAERLAVLRPEVLIHHGSAEDVVLLHTALAKRAWRPRALIGVSAPYGSSETAEMVGPAFEGTLAVGVVPFGVKARLAPDAAMVATLYEQRFGASPRSGLSLSHFAGTALCFDVLRLAKSADKDKVLGVVHGLALARGSLANGWGAQFGKDGQNLRAFAALSQWQGGKLVTLLPGAGAASGAVFHPGG